MSQFKDKKLDMKELISDFCKQVKGLSQQVFLTVWEAFRKFSFQQLEFDRTIVILDSFYLQMTKQNNCKTLKLMPTSTLLAEASLNYRSDDNDLSNIGSLVSITQGNLYKQIQAKDKQNMDITKQNAYFIYSFTFKHIKNLIKKYKSISMQLDFLGTIVIYERIFVHEPDLKNINSEKIKIKQLIQKDAVQNCSDLKRHSIQMRSKQNLLEKTKPNFMNSSSSSFKPMDQSYSETSEVYRNKINTEQSNEFIQKRPFFHELIDTNQPENVRIMNDLLGAGIDPLTYDYNHSHLVQNSDELFNYKFEKPSKPKLRFPALIDKFSRTIGSQLTGAKVSTSSSIRIGCNYSPAAKNYYIDLSKKQIMRVPQQITIKLQQNRQIIPATTQEQYQYIVSQNNDKQLQKKVQLRKQIFSRYRQYFMKHIPNQCVAPLSRQTLKRIVQRIKPIVRSLGKTQGKKIFDILINEVNRHYYISDKKSIVDYILKDDSEKNRTGIHILFKPVHDWGIVMQKETGPKIKRQNTFMKKELLQKQFLIYPELILQIVKHNQLINKISIFSEDVMKNVRPMNVLYYLKKCSNHLSQIVNFMNQKWIKGAVQIITKNMNWKKENMKNFKVFLSNVHTLMSNKLKQILYRELDMLTIFLKYYDPENPPLYPKPALYLHLGEENKKIVFTDDLNNIYKKEIVQIHRNFVKQLSQLLSPECYITEGEQKFLSSIDEKDKKLQAYNELCDKIIYQSYEIIEKIKNEMKKFEKVFKYKEGLTYWAKNSFSIAQLDIKLDDLKNIEEEIQNIPFYQTTLSAVVDCHQLKKKLAYDVKLMRYFLFETIENQVKRNSENILDKIKQLSEKTSKQIKSTADYVQLSKLIQSIKTNELIEISQQICQNQQTLMKLFTIKNSFVSQDLLKQVYSLNKEIQKLKNKVQMNEERILKQRSELQKTLRQRISNFQTLTISQYRQINMKIDSFQIRKLYHEYLIYLSDYKQKSEKNMKQMAILNHEEEDLKWAVTSFTSAIDLQNLVTPNFQLWGLVSEFDLCIREWKHVELCNFDADSCEKKINYIDQALGKVLNRLKNFSSLKIGHELQNDVKQIITRQLSIIRIFSHPGLKQRHWHLFNKKLAIPGYDLKEITYGRIKMLYDYEKNLKILTSISNQAAKQFEIQSQKNQMHMYWYSLNCEIYSETGDQYMIFIKEDFLNKHIAVVEDHLIRTILIKNSPFSKALIQMLTDWQNYLISAKNILIGFKVAQQKFIAIKDIFKIDQISKFLPIENTQFQSIANIWKSVIRKVLQQPKISELFKSQKIVQILEQISKKSSYIKNSLPTYLHAKRVEFPRFFFLKDSEIIEIFSLLNKGNEKSALKKIAQSCFNGLDMIEKNDKGYRLVSSIDSIQISLEKQTNSKRQKIKIIQELPMILAKSQEKIKEQIRSLIGMRNLNENEINLSKFTLTALLAFEHIKFSERIKQAFTPSKSQTNLTLHDQIQKYLTKYRRYLIESIESKVSLLTKTQVQKSDMITFRRLCYLKLVQQLIDKDEKISSQDYQMIPKLVFTEKDNEKGANDLVLMFKDQIINFDYQYLGHDVLGYQMLNLQSLAFMNEAVKNAININPSLIHNQSDHINIRLLSQMASKFYKTLSLSQFITQTQNSVYELISGLLNADFWINLNMDNEKIMKINCDFLSIISDILEQKRKKLQNGTGYCLVKENEIILSRNTGIFFFIPKQTFEKLPQRLFRNFRPLSTLNPQSNDLASHKQFLTSELFIDWQTVPKLKIIVEVLKNISPLKINCIELFSNFVKIIEKIEEEKLEKNQSIVACKLLEQYFTKSQEEDLVRNFLKLQQKENQSNIFLRKNVNENESLREVSEIQLYLKDKIEQVQLEQSFFDAIIVYGDFGLKTTLIHHVLKQFKFTPDECNQITINASFFNLSEQKFNQSTLGNFQLPQLQTILQKVQRISEKNKNKLTEKITPVIIDGQIDESKIKKISLTLKALKRKHKSNLEDKSFVCFIECSDIKHLNPQNVLNFGKVFMNNGKFQDKNLYQNWISTLALKQQELQCVKSLLPSFQGIIYQVCKSKNILTSQNKDLQKRYIYMRSFFKFFEVYLLNLSSKQVQVLPEFQTENYIINSFIFSAYWSLCIGYVSEESKKQFDLYIRQVFGCQYDMPQSIQDYFLNEQNEWISWQNLKEQFAPEKQSQSMLCSLWVPTVQNTKFYTIIIKLIEKDIPIMLIGSQTGKSTLLRQISNFEITYSTFIIDCNLRTNVLKVNESIKEKIQYGDDKKYLVLIDDVHLPLNDENSQITDLVQQIIKRSSLPNLNFFGDINIKLKKSNFILSANEIIQSERHSISNSSFYRLLSLVQPICLKRIDQKQMQCIFRPYINYSFIHNQLDNTILKLQNVIISFVIKTFQAFHSITAKNSSRKNPLKICDVRKVVQSLCRMTTEHYKNKFDVFNFLVYETFAIFSGKLKLAEMNQSHVSREHQLLANLKKMLESEHSKNCNPQKNAKQFQNLLSSYIYKDIPSFDQNMPSVPDLNTLKQLMQKQLSSKPENQLFLTQKLTNMVQKLMHLLKSSSSHVILIDEKHRGSISLIKIVAQLKNLTYVQLGTSTEAHVFLQEIIKILKTGGKIDECICCLPNRNFVQKDFFELINSLVSSAEFYESFSQVQLEQIIKSFNSQKKILKKDIKKSEIIRKIKEKVNSIFHFFICIDWKQYQNLKQTYPNLIRDSFVVVGQECNQKQMKEIASNFMSGSCEQVNTITKAFHLVYKGLNEISTQCRSKKQYFIQIFRLLHIYQTFSFYLQKTDSSNNQPLNTWQKKISSNQQKIIQLKQQKADFQEANKSHFQELNELRLLIKEKEELLAQKKQEFNKVDSDFTMKKQKHLLERTEFYLKSESFTQMLNNQIDDKIAKYLKTTFKIGDIKQDGSLYKVIGHYMNKTGEDTIQCEQLIRVMPHLAKDAFAIIESQISANEFQTQLQSSSHPIQKSFLLLIVSLYQQIQSYIETYNKFSQSEVGYRVAEEQYFKKQSECRYVQDQIEEIKDEIQEQNDKNSKIVELHDQMQSKIQQLQGLIDVFNKVRKVTNQHNSSKEVQHSEDMTKEDSLSQTQKQSLKILFTICLKQNITNIESAQFKKIKSTLHLLGMDVPEKSLLLSLPMELRIRFENCFDDNTLQAIVNYLTIQLSPFYCVAIDDEKIVENSLQLWSKKQVYHFSSEQVDQLKSMLMAPGLIIIRNPSELLVSQLKPIIEHSKQFNQSRKPISTIDEFNFHDSAKIIFVYKTRQQINERISQNSDWICNFVQDNAALQKKSQNFLSKLVSNKDVEQIADTYTQKTQDLQNLGQRMHSLIIKMKKENLSQEQILQRIREVDERKHSIEQDMKHYKNELKQIFNYKPEVHKYSNLLVTFCQNYHVNLAQILKILSTIYKKKANNLQKTFQYLSSLIENVFRSKKHEKSQKVISRQQKCIQQNNHKAKSKQEERVSEEQMKKIVAIEQSKISMQHLSDLMQHIKDQNFILRTDEPSIAKKCLLLHSINSNFNLSERAVTQINSLSFVSNSQQWILVQIKVKKDWQNLLSIMKSINDKKLSIKLLIISPLDITIPNQTKSLPEIMIGSLAKFYVKQLFEQQAQNSNRKVEPFFNYYAKKSCRSQFDKIARLQELLQTSG